MRLLRFSFESCMHNRKTTILNLLICMITVILMNVYAGNLIHNQEQLVKLPEVMEIPAFVTNLCGNMDSILHIKLKQVDGVLNSEYVKDPVVTARLKIGFGEFAPEDYFDNLKYYVTGSNSIAGIPGLKPEELTFQDENYRETFFNSNERICIIDENLLRQKNMKIGDTIDITSYNYRYEEYHMIYIDPLECSTFKIVGSMNMNEYVGTSIRPDILFPLGTVRKLFDENGVTFFADSCSFKVKDPFKLNEFKQEMHDIGFLPVAYAAEYQYDGNALTVKDETFVHSAEQLMNNQKLLLLLLPFLCFIVLCIGFVIAVLLMKGRTAEYAIMRSLGQTHRESLYQLCLEYAMVAIAGSLFGILLSLILLKTALYILLLTAFAFLIFYIVGTIAALSSLKKLSVMSVLSKND